MFDEAPRRERGAVGREQRGRLMLATIGCCGVSCRHRPRELVRSFSRHAIAHARDILCALALALALTPPAAVFGCKGWSIARAWLFGSSSGATPRVVGFGRSASAHSFLRRLASSGVCVFDARPVKQATEPSGRELEVAASDESALKLFNVSPVIDISDSKFSVWLSKPRSHRLLYLA